MSITTMFHYPLGLLVPWLIWMLLVCFFWALLLAVKDGFQRLRRLHQIPCDRCRYYTGSPYLKCPVHPLTVLSEAAIHCSDFEACDRPCTKPVPPWKGQSRLTDRHRPGYRLGWRQVFPR